MYVLAVQQYGSVYSLRIRYSGINALVQRQATGI